MSKSVVPPRKNGVQARKIGDEWLLHDTGTGSVHVLNDSAHRVWEMCDGRRSLDEMEQALRDTYEVPSEVDLRGDLKRALDTLREKDLLEPPS